MSGVCVGAEKMRALNERKRKKNTDYEAGLISQLFSSTNENGKNEKEK